MDHLSGIEILAPTGLEYWAVRAVRPPAVVRRAGLALAAWDNSQTLEAVIVCGLAGGLIPALEPGAVLVPDLVRSADGPLLRCDARIRDAFIRGARSIGLNPETGPLLTATSIVTGPAREEWARRGFVAADMETALLVERSARFATVRVVLDSPRRSISDRWTHAGRAALNPTLWPELLWLAHAAPRYALRAARVLRAGLHELERAR